MVSEQIAKTRLERKISIQSLPENSAEQAKACYKTEAAIDSIKREGALHTQKRLLLKQAELVTSDKLSTKESRRWFMHTFTRCPHGLGVVGGRHDTTVRGNFRKELVIAKRQSMQASRLRRVSGVQLFEIGYTKIGPQLHTSSLGNKGRPP